MSSGTGVLGFPGTETLLSIEAVHLPPGRQPGPELWHVQWAEMGNVGRGGGWEGQVRVGVRSVGPSANCQELRGS